MDAAEIQQIRQGRSKFAAMVATYGLGVFNDSFFRNSAILLAITAASLGDETLEGMEGWIMTVFTLPYLLLASTAGWLADRFSKRYIVIGAKVLELAAMICGAIGIITGSWTFIMMMVFTMGAQSCLFSPALNGSIPELFPESYVNRANALLKVFVTMMILGGISFSGVALDVPGQYENISMGRIVVGGGAVLISAMGMLISFGVPGRPAANPSAKFPWTGPVDTIKQLLKIRHDRLLSLVVLADSFVWFAGAMLVLLIQQMAIDQFSCTKSMAGYMVASQVVGVAIGGLLSNKFATGKRWFRVLPVGAGAMGVFLMLIAFLPLIPDGSRLPAAFILLAMVGIFGGIFMIPCEAFVQIRPAADRKGTVIASVNFLIFAGILLSGPIEILLVKFTTPTNALAVLGVVSLIMAAVLWAALRKDNKHD